MGHSVSLQNKSKVEIVTHFLQSNIAALILIQEGFKLCSILFLGRVRESNADREWLKVSILAIVPGFLNIGCLTTGVGSRKIILFVYFSYSAISFFIS